MTGVWDGVHLRRFGAEELRLFIEPKGVWLEAGTSLGDRAVVVPLTAKEVDADGGVLFTFAAQGGDNDRGGDPPILASGRVRVALKPGQDGRPNRIYLQPLTRESKPVPGGVVTLDQPLVAGAEAERVLFDSPPRPYAYRDWRSGGGNVDVKPELRIAEMLTRVRSDRGWRCLAESSYTVRSGSKTTIKWREPIDRMYVFYTPSSETGLTYSLTVNPPGPGFSQRVPVFYPQLTTVHAMLVPSDVTISLYLRPASFAERSRERSMPVSVLILGRTLGDTGPGCSLESVQR